MRYRGSYSLGIRSLLFMALMLLMGIHGAGSSFKTLEIQNNLGKGKGPVYSVCLSEEGNLLATADYGGIYIWNTETFKEIIRLEGHSDYVWGISWNKDGDYLASAGQDGRVIIWKKKDFSMVESLYTGWAFCTEWFSDDKYLAVGNYFGEIQIWDTSNWEKKQILKNHVESPVICITCFDDGKIAAGKLNGDIEIWDTLDNKLIFSFNGYSDQRCDVNGISCSPDGAILATAHQDSHIRLWNMEEYSLIISLKTNSGWVRGIKWSPDGKYLASAGQDGKILLWSTAGYEKISESQKLSLPVWSLQWSKDADKLFSGSGAYDYPHTGFSIIWKIM